MPAAPPQYEPATPPEVKPPEAKPADAAPPPKTPDAAHHSSGISKEPASIPVDQIIQQFAQREVEFKTERENFTYVQTFVVQTIDSDGEPDGEYRMTSDITFTPAGKRYEVVTSAPVHLLDLPGGAGKFALITLDNGFDHTKPTTFGPRGLINIDVALDEVLQKYI